MVLLQDPEGLLAAETQPDDDDWQPEADGAAAGQQPGRQQRSSRRSRSKAAGRGAASGRAGDTAAAAADNGAVPSATAAAAALLGWLETVPGEGSSPTHFSPACIQHKLLWVTSTLALADCASCSLVCVCGTLRLDVCSSGWP
jgi:hypothetical protein